MGWTDGCIRVKVRIADFAAFNSKTFIWHLLSNNVHHPLVLCPWQKASYPFKEASDAVINWGDAEIIHLPLVKRRFGTHQSSFPFTSADKVIFELLSPVSCSSKICCHCMARFCRGAGRTTIAVDARQPTNWFSSLMEVDDFPSRSWHCFTIFSFFSWGKVSVISMELTFIPKNCIFWHSSSTDFLWFI